MGNKVKLISVNFMVQFAAATILIINEAVVITKILPNYEAKSLND